MFNSCPEFVSDLLPATDEMFNLGSPSKKWLGLYLRRFTVDSLGNADLVGSLQITGSLSAGTSTLFSTIPAVDDTYDLGTAVKRWSKLYLSGDAYVNTIREAIVGAGVTIDGVLKTNGRITFPVWHMFREVESSFLTLRNLADTDYATLRCKIQAMENLLMAWGTYFGNDGPNGLLYFSSYQGGGNYINHCTMGDEGFSILRAGNIDFLDDKFLKIGKDSDGALPAASSTYRGKMIRVEGGAGVADKLYVCMKSASDAYSWVQVASG